MKVVTAAQMRTMEMRWSADSGLPTALLMENAGRGVASVTAEVASARHGARIAVVCGSGNNGGDGFVCARYLAANRLAPDVLHVAPPGAMRGEAAGNFRELSRCAGVRLVALDSCREAADACRRYDLIVDALLGTGTNGPLRQPYGSVIDAMNQSGATIVSIDLPSGLDSDTGAVASTCVAAHHTVACGAAKLGCFVGRGPDVTGRLHVASLGFELPVPVGGTSCVLVEGGLSEVIPASARLRKRVRDSNKGDYGRVVVVGGSATMSGAPALAAVGALRAGAGLVFVYVPGSVHTAAAALAPECMVTAAAEDMGALTEAVVPSVLERAGSTGVICAGPGMTAGTGTCAIVRQLIAADVPLVLDADALNAWSTMPDVRPSPSRKAPVTITPHPGEAARLLGVAIEELQADRVTAASRIAAEYGAITVLKGSNSVIAAPGSATVINTSGNPGMATAGAGDVLAGACAAAIGAGVACGTYDDAMYRVALAVYLHGSAGDLVAEQRGEAGMIAGDIAAALPLAARQCLETEGWA